MKRTPLILLAIGFTTITDAQTFTLKSNDIGGQATQKQFLNGLSIVVKVNNNSPDYFIQS